LLTDPVVRGVAGRPGVQRAALDPASADAAAETSPDGTSAPPVEAGTVDPDAVLLAALTDAPRAGVSVEELAQRIGRRRTWVYKRLHDHLTAGRAVRLRRGRWAARRGGAAAPRDER